jgi:sorbose reductase
MCRDPPSSLPVVTEVSLPLLWEYTLMSPGIGLAISETIAKAGGNVAIIYNSAKDAPQVAEDLASKHGVKVQAWQCNVGDPEAVTKTFKEVDEKMGPVTGLVANAGVSVVKDALEMKKEDFSFVCE